MTEELQLLSSFMLQTYLRPGDLPLLKHKHIQLKQMAKGDQYLLVYATSKTIEHYAVAMPHSIGLYLLIKTLHPGKAEPDALVTQQILSIFERHSRRTQPPAEGVFQSELLRA